MLILHPHGTGQDSLDRQQETWEWLRQIEQQKNFRGTILHWACFEETDYPKAIQRVWNYPGPLVILEHDMVPNSYHDLIRLVNCEHHKGYCSQAYKLIINGERVYAQNNGGKTTEAGPVLENAGYALYSGFGFVKFPTNRLSIDWDTLWNVSGPGYTSDGLVPSWKYTDWIICERMKAAGLTWHVHWPEAKHNH